MPRCFGASASVRASRIPKSAWCAHDGPHLLPVHHPLVAVAHGPGRAARRGRSRRPGSLKSWHHTVVAAGDRRQEPALLLVGAVGEDRRRGHADPDPRDRTRQGR